MSGIVEAFIILFFLWIFTYPAKGILRFLADFISENMNHVPFLAPIVKSGSAIIKVDQKIANIAEVKRAIRAKWIVSAIITGVFFYPFLVHIIVFIVCFLFGSYLN